MRKLYKTKIVIWSDWDPHKHELTNLAREADEGAAYCSEMVASLINDPTKDPDWDGCDFFDLDE